MACPLLWCALLFPLVSLGLGWPLARRLALDAAEKLVAAVVISLGGVYFFAFAAYWLDLPRAAFWALPAAAVLGLAFGRHDLGELGRDRGARSLLLGQGLVWAWCLGWLACVASYSGGGWTGDWFEHWERTRFFIEHWPLEAKFLGYAALPARPPLANLVAGACLAPLAWDFAGYQLVMALLNGLVFLPAALLARRLQARWQPAGAESPGSAAVAVLAVLLMLNPSFMENSTFAWTKLFAAFFTLAGLYFFLRTQDPDAPQSAGPLCAGSLAAGTLAHYSAGPYVVLLVVAWFCLGRRRWADPAYWRQTLRLGLVGGLILATWFGWSFAVYGADATLFSNSSVAVPEARQGNQLVKIALNLRDTVVPHFLRRIDPQLIEQRSAWSYARDWFFQLYQVNLPFVFGSVAWLAIAASLWRDARAAARRARAFWGWLTAGAIILGVAVHGARDHWGLAHICLQAFVVLGLAYLAGQWPRLGRGWRSLLIAGAAVDFSLGIALQFAAQSQTPDLALLLGHAPAGAAPLYNEGAVMNLGGKVYHQLAFFGDVLGSPAWLTLGLLGVVLFAALHCVRVELRKRG